MLPQHSEHREALHADVALVRPLSGVRAHVLLQPRRSTELSAADATGELLRPLVELPVLQQLLHRQEVLLTQEAVKIHLPLSVNTFDFDHLDLLGVLLQVFPQQTRPVEALAAQRAGVRLLPRVQPHVIPEGRRRGENLLADGAGVQVLSRVGFLVVDEPRPGGEALGAQRAEERPFSSVSALVLDEVAPLDESSPAHRAAVGFLCGVAEPVTPQAAELGVADTAVGAGIRLLSGVNPLVDRHVYLLCEAFAAQRAAVRLLARVGGHVIDQAGGTRKLPAAYRAPVAAL